MIFVIVVWPVLPVFFLLKNHTLRPNCKFLILAIFYNAKKRNNAHIFKTTTPKKIHTGHNLFLLFSQVKMVGGGSVQPPSPSKLGVFNTPTKLGVFKTPSKLRLRNIAHPFCYTVTVHRRSMIVSGPPRRRQHLDPLPPHHASTEKSR